MSKGSGNRQRKHAWCRSENDRIFKRGIFGMPVTPLDYPEDYHMENGKYQNICYDCDRIFFGHKRRVACKECAT